MESHSKSEKNPENNIIKTLMKPLKLDSLLVQLLWHLSLLKLVLKVITAIEEDSKLDNK